MLLCLAYRQAPEVDLDAGVESEVMTLNLSNVLLLILQ